jgi:hypothetical protein
MKKQIFISVLVFSSLFGFSGCASGPARRPEIPLIPREFQPAFNVGAQNTARILTERATRGDCVFVQEFAPAFAEFARKLEEQIQTRSIDVFEMIIYGFKGVSEGLNTSLMGCTQSSSTLKRQNLP